jgi:AAA ATPase domain
MEELAEAGRAYLTAETARLVSGFFRLRDLGSFELKGVSVPVQVYDLEGVGALHTPIEVSRARGFSRFVGREDETTTLEAALARAIGGNAQVVGIVGEPGVGKSRLCFEFLERCRARGLAIFEAHGVPHGKALPLLPMLELFRNFFGITDQDSDQVAREKIAGRFLLLDESLREVLPLVFDLLGVPDPERPARSPSSSSTWPSVWEIPLFSSRRTNNSASHRPRLENQRSPGNIVTRVSRSTIPSDTALIRSFTAKIPAFSVWPGRQERCGFLVTPIRP